MKRSFLLFLLLFFLFTACRQKKGGVARQYRFPTSNASLDSLLGAIKVVDAIAHEGGAEDKAFATVFRGWNYHKTGQYRQKKETFRQHFGFGQGAFVWKLGFGNGCRGIGGGCLHF